MKSNELMIGDWVYIEDQDSKTGRIYTKIVCITEDNTEWLSPIPLTEKMLEKNGFKNYDAILEYQFEEDGEQYRFYIKKMYNKDHVCDAWGTNIGGVIPSVIMHVHELQHALRLCGLNELADNFKL